MNWPKLIKDLTSAGLTQVRIAELCDVAQSTISDLGSGKIKSPSYALGVRLIELHRQQRSKRPEAA